MVGFEKYKSCNEIISTDLTDLKGSFGWKSKKVRGKVEKIEKWEDGSDLIFSNLCLVGKIEKWRDKKLFYFVRKKNEMIEK